MIKLMDISAGPNFISKTITKHTDKLLLIGVIFLFQSCAAYSSSFPCPNAKGAMCAPMDEIDKLIKSGKIREYTKEKRSCKGGICSDFFDAGNDLPKLRHENIELQFIDDNKKFEGRNLDNKDDDQNTETYNIGEQL